MTEETSAQKVARIGRRITEILDNARQPDYVAGPYRIINTDIDGNPNHYGGVYFSEEDAREIMTLFAENPHQHHQEYECFPALPDRNPSPDIA